MGVKRPESPRAEPTDLHATVVENLFDGVYYVDRGRRITYWNPGAERISGYTADDVVGRRCFDDILGHVDEEGRRLCFTHCPLVRAMAQRRGVEAEVYLHHRDGTACRSTCGARPSASRTGQWSEPSRSSTTTRPTATP